MEQYRSRLAPRTQRRSQNIHFDAAKIRTFSETSEFSSSECREKLVFALLSREKIRLTGQILEQRNQYKFIFSLMSRDKIQ
jgi:hypothetical protein